MDDFVRNKLSEWGLSTLIETFKGQGINEDHFYNLEDKAIRDLIPKIGPRKTFKRQFKLLKVLQSTSEENDTRNVDMDPREESSQCQSPNVTHKRHNYAADESIVLEVKNIMEDVKRKLQKGKKTELNDFVQDEISDLEKRELVGVFGRTRAGKSSLINAIVGETNLLPSGSVCACTSVMFKVEANNDSKKFEAEIEFIKEEGWKEELWYNKTVLDLDFDPEDDDDDDVRERMTVLYREDWKSKSIEELMDKKYFTEIPEFLTSNKKTLKCDSDEKLVSELKRIIREDKKTVYSSLTSSIQKNMQKCCTDAAGFKGVGSLEKMRCTIKKLVHGEKDTMFQLNKLRGKILEKLKETLMESIERSLGTDEYPVPDVSGELVRVEILYSQLKADANSN